jgi:hypothetical protein
LIPLRLLAYILFFAVIALPLALGGGAYLAVADQPTVNRATEFTPAHIERATRIVEKNDPRTLKDGAVRTISLSPEEVDLALNYLAGRYANGSSRVELKPGAAVVTASFELPKTPLGRFINLSAVLRETTARPVLDKLTIGRLPLPGWLADALLRSALRWLSAREDYRIASELIKKYSIADGRLTVTYAWQSGIADRIKAVMLPPGEQERLQAYQTRLSEISRQLPAGSVSLANLLPPLFKLAAERSATRDPVAENQALIVVVTFFINGKGLYAIVPAARDWPSPPPRNIVLAGRDDFPKHFAISAALAATAGAPLADVIGLYKEVEDSRGGSGFSFADLAADRAGTRFGELAAGNRETAVKLQQQVGTGVREADLLPPVADLPESMAETDFKRRYGGIGAPAYKSMVADIERRIAALPLYR